MMLKKLLPLLLLLAVWTGTASATQYFVDNSGSPACNNGTLAANTQSNPFCTVAYAMTQMGSLVAGDSMLFKCGDSWNEEMDLPTITAGTSGSPITIGHYGANCVLPLYSTYNGTNSSTAYTYTLPGLNGGGLGGRSHCILDAATNTIKNLVIDGFNCHDTLDGGINIQCPGAGACPNVTIKNNVVHQVGGGAYSGATEGPDLTGPTYGCLASGATGFTVQGPCDSGCAPTSGTSGNCNGTPRSGYDIDGGINFNDDACPGTGTSTTQDNVQILNNIVWDNGGHNNIRVHYDSGTSTLISNNVSGPGCSHNCFDTKGTNATVANNVAFCPTSGNAARAHPGEQCTTGNAGAYYENTCTPGTNSPTNGFLQTWKYNLFYNIGICLQQNANPSFLKAIIVNNTCDTPYGTGALYAVDGISGSVIKKNILGTNCQGGTSAGCGIHVTSDSSSWDCNNTFTGLSGQVAGTHDISVNPQYVNTTSTPPNYNTNNTTNNSAGSPNCLSETSSAFVGQNAQTPTTSPPSYIFSD